jgi:hypothetical protein
MTPPRRSLQNLNTVAGLADRRRRRTPATALMELSTLANERQRLQQELDRWEVRRREISARLEAIGAKEQRLQQYLATPLELPPAQPEGRAAGNGVVKTTDFSY